MDGNFETLRAEFLDILRQSFQTPSTQALENITRSLVTRQQLTSSVSFDSKAPLDQAFRDLLLELLEQESEVMLLRKLVDFCILTCRKDLSSPTMPVVLLSDIFDALTLDICQEMFLYVEENVEIWKEKLFFTCCKNNLLRLCNDLLRRLSRSTATVFCGRILLFLAKFFPFSERSGLNIVSEFNLENVTEYGTSDVQQDSEMTDLSAESAGNQQQPQQNGAASGGDAEKTKPPAITFSFYRKFWSLQDFFRNPNQLYSKVQWKMFCSYTSSVLSTFQGLKLEHVENNGAQFQNDELKKKMYFSKYLTSQKLLDLQLYDVNFRRAILVQFLVLFQYLSSSVKFKSDNYELKTDQKEYIQTCTEQVYNLLKEIPPDGKEFAKIVSNILSREEYWNAWKNDGCPELGKASTIQEKSHPPSSTENQPHHNQDARFNEDPKLGDIIKEHSQKGKYYMGSSELTKLWNLVPDNLEACKSKHRDFLPTLDDYFAEALTGGQTDSNSNSSNNTTQNSSSNPNTNTNKEDHNNLLADPNFGWRALRLLAKRSPHFFTYSTTIINPLSAYLEMMCRKIAHERPGSAMSRSFHDTQDHKQETFDAEEENLFKDTQMEETGEDALKPPLEGEDFNMAEDAQSGRAEYVPRKSASVTQTQLQIFAEKLATDWKKLALKLGFEPDEVQFFSDNNPDTVSQAKNMLQLWFDDDEDATLENFLYILEGLGMDRVAEAVRHELNQ